MKRIFWAIVVSLFLFTGMAAAFYDGHIYINGIVNSVGSDTITISRQTYKIDPKCRVVMQYKNHGSYYEKHAKRYEISTGDSVTAKNVGNVLYEIIIEGWKR